MGLIFWVDSKNFMIVTNLELKERVSGTCTQIYNEIAFKMALLQLKSAQKEGHFGLLNCLKIKEKAQYYHIW